MQKHDVQSVFIFLHDADFHHKSSFFLILTKSDSHKKRDRTQTHRRINWPECVFTWRAFCFTESRQPPLFHFPLSPPLGKAWGEGSLWNDRICSLHGRESKHGRVSRGSEGRVEGGGGDTVHQPASKHQVTAGGCVLSYGDLLTRLPTRTLSLFC